jgi:organic hydroperoxide reductase OsmC/OhrA
MKTLYSTKATVTGGRAGSASLSDNDLTIVMAFALKQIYFN